MKTKAKKAESKTPKSATLEISTPNDEGQDTGYGRAISDVAETLWQMGAGSAFYENEPLDEALFQFLEYKYRDIDVPLDTKIERISGLVPPTRDFIMAELHSISMLAYVVLIEQAVEFAPQRALKQAGQSYKKYVPVRQDLRMYAERFLDRWFDYLEEKTKAETRDARGGPRRKPRQRVSAQLMRNFAARVDALQPLWKFIIDFFERNEYEAECHSMLRQSERFKAFVTKTGNPPDILIRRVFKRKPFFEEQDSVDGEEMPRHLHPQVFMLEQAADEMGLPYDHEQLRKFYREGKKKSKAAG